MKMTHFECTAKFEFTYSTKKEFVSKCLAVAPKTLRLRIEKHFKKFFLKIERKQLDYSFDKSHVTIIAHNKENINCKLSTPDNLIYNATIRSANCMDSILNLYYNQSTTPNELVVELYLPSYDIKGCVFTHS